MMMTATEAFQKHPLNVISHVLVIIGALNWLAFGLQHKDLVLPLVGSHYADYVYILIGVAGVFCTIHFVKWVLGHYDAVAPVSSTSAPSQ